MSTLRRSAVLLCLAGGFCGPFWEATLGRPSSAKAEEYLPVEPTNVASQAAITLDGAPFFEGGWGGGLVVASDTIVDGAFLPRCQQWDQGAVWWDSCDGMERFIVIDLGGTYVIESFVVQGDDNDAYNLYCRDVRTGLWELAYDVPNYDVWPDPYSYGMQTRPNPYDDGERHYLPLPIVTDCLRFEGRMDDGDMLFSVSEIQAYGWPHETVALHAGLTLHEPPPFMVGGTCGTVCGVTPGHAFDITMDVHNRGCDDTGCFYVRFHLSPDTDLDRDDPYLGEAFVGGLLGGGSGQIRLAMVPSPLDLPSGDYYLGWVVESSDDDGGSDEDDDSDGGYPGECGGQATASFGGLLLLGIALARRRGKKNTQCGATDEG